MSDPSLKPRRRPQQERSRLLVEAILDAAARVLEQHGYAHATTNRIAERAGVSIGSLYQYFPSKDAILVALVERHLAEGAAVVGPLLAGLDPAVPLERTLAELTGAMVELHRHEPGLHRVLVEECPRPPELRERLDGIFAVAVAAVARFLDAHPDVRLADVDAAARLAVQVIESVTHQLVVHDDGAGVDRLTRETVRMLALYLQAPAED